MITLSTLTAVVAFYFIPARVINSTLYISLLAFFVVLASVVVGVWDSWLTYNSGSQEICQWGPAVDIWVQFLRGVSFPIVSGLLILSIYSKIKKVQAKKYFRAAVVLGISLLISNIVMVYFTTCVGDTFHSSRADHSLEEIVPMIENH